MPVFAQLNPDCAKSGSTHINVEVSGHSITEGNQAGTNSTEDEISTTEPGEDNHAPATGSCFHDGKDEESDKNIDENEV